MHDESTITRGNPSFVWRFGQDRRLEMIRHFAPLEGRVVLDIGCGIGTYVRKFAQSGAHAFGVDIEFERLRAGVGARQSPSRPDGRDASPLRLAQAVSEHNPFPDNIFDMALLHEVIEHVQDDRQTVAEALRIVKPGGRVLIFAPNRGWPFETHGIFWRGQYRFGNIPLIPYLPDLLRNQYAPHVRTYSVHSIRRLADGLPARIVAHTQVYPGYDNIVARRPALGKVLRTITYALESTPLRVLGLSHLMVIQKNDYKSNV